jgi:cytochrome bd-type quinol oxidase subunit 2
MGADGTDRMGASPQRLIAFVAMLAVGVLAVCFVLVSWLSWEGVYENNDDQADAGLYFLASLVGLATALGAIAGLWTGRRKLTMCSVLAQAGAVAFVLLVAITSQHGLGDEDARLVLVLGGVLAVDALAGSAVVVARRST